MLDSPVYDKLRAMVPKGGVPIFVQLCWDGALVCNQKTGKSMWPLCYSIMNLPPCLRNKVNIGMHVGSFCEGSTASLDIFAKELKELWEYPIIVDGVAHYVMVSQVLMDGPGRSKYCKCQTTTAHAGCNICSVTGILLMYLTTPDFSFPFNNMLFYLLGREFGLKKNGRRTVYDSFRSYLDAKDPRRKKDSEHNQENDLHYTDDDHNGRPRNRTYEEYKSSAKEAQRRGKAVDGVKGLWSLAILVYAHLIHWTMDLMHTFNNVIADINKSLRPTNSGKKAKKGGSLLFKSANRSYCASVVSACEHHDIHAGIQTKTAPAWVLTKEKCIEMDEQLRQVIGSYKSEEIPQNVMRSGTASKSHDTIQWATLFGRYLLSDQGKYTDNIIEIFDIMSILNANRLNCDMVRKELLPRLINALADRSGFVPPSESCVTLHELIHVCEQVNEIGNARCSTLYKFEKMNKWLKGHAQNSAKCT